jgi:cation:H+ antiporter
VQDDKKNEIAIMATEALSWRSIWSGYHLRVEGSFRLNLMNFIDIGLIVAGLALLIAGGEALVRGAGTLASRAGISPLVIGLVVVSAATSAPELAVTMGAVISGEPDLAVGNVIGSNIVNILLILGLSAVISPLVIKRQLVRFDMPVMVGLSILLLVVSLDGVISVLDGVLLFGALVIHTVISILLGRKEIVDPKAKPDTMPLNSKPVPLWLALLLLAAGIGLLVFGAQLLVAGAVSIATSLGISSLVIGLTVVAIGTSLPELATSLIAIIRGETDMAVGNVVGSNIFNIGMVLGLPATFFGDGIPVAPAAVAIDLPLMLATAIALLPIAFTGFMVKRWEGLLFVLLYTAYTVYLVLASVQHDAAVGFSTIMLWFVLPLVAITLIALTSFELGVLKERKAARLRSVG